VSHKFLDEALTEAGASQKSRGMFRAIYEKAAAVVRVRKRDGTDVFSTPFDVNRGVVQGAIDSPWHFIIALECIFRRCDNDGGIDLGLPCGNILRLEYADDAALLCKDINEATLQLTRIAITSRKLADMEGSRPKTESQVCKPATKLPMPTELQIRDTLGKNALVCCHCDRTYSTAHALKTHLTHKTSGCKWTDEANPCNWETNIITAVRGGGNTLRFFKVDCISKKYLFNLSTCTNCEQKSHPPKSEQQRSHRPKPPKPPKPPEPPPKPRGAATRASIFRPKTCNGNLWLVATGRACRRSLLLRYNSCS
jgi:hypothetical protein